MKKELQHILHTMKEVNDHLDYCGWGDSWERECATAQKLPEKWEKALIKMQELVDGVKK